MLSGQDAHPVFHYCIKPKAASSDKWRNFYSFLSARMPWLKRKALAVKAWISYVYHKMYRSDNGKILYIGSCHLYAGVSGGGLSCSQGSLFVLGGMGCQREGFEPYTL